MAKKISKTKDLGAGFMDSVSHGKVKDVTSTNYAGKASAVATKAGGKTHGVMICPIENPREWGSWHNYLKGIGRYQKYMTYVGKQRAHSRSATRFWVPTPFPHMFDSDRLELTDDAAADHFVKAQERRRAEVGSMGTEEERLAQAQAAVKRVRDNLKSTRGWNDEDKAKKPPKFEDTQHLVNCVNGENSKLPHRNPARWRDRDQLRASRDRINERLGMTPPNEERDDVEV